MLLKFVVGGCATNGWLIGAGKVVNWYKAEGDRVEYGQDLCDLLVEEVRVPRGVEERPRPSSSRRQARRPRREPAGQASRSKASATSRPRRGRQGRDTLAG